MHRIDTPGNAAGLFVPPNPVTGQQAVVVDSPWLNDLQENIMAVLTAASIAPVKGTYTQLRDAIKVLISSAVGHVVDTGAANAYVIAPSPALPAYAEGVSYTVHFIHANTGASTIRVSGLPARAIVREDGTPLQNGDIPGGSESLIIDDGASYRLQAEIPATATTTLAGIVALATDAQTLALADTTHAVTPSNLAALDASTTQQGLVALATAAQALALADTTHVLTPSNLASVFASSLGSTGRMLLPGGLLIQWMLTGSLPSAGNSVTFGTSFPSAVYGLVLCPIGAFGIGGGQLQDNYSGLSTSGFTLNNNSSNSRAYFVIVLGK